MSLQNEYAVGAVPELVPQVEADRGLLEHNGKMISRQFTHLGNEDNSSLAAFYAHISLWSRVGLIQKKLFIISPDDWKLS